MPGVNKVILVGHLGKDPEARYFENGLSVATFTLATTESYTRDNKRIEQTEWHNIVAWRNLADTAVRYLRKGKLVYIEGKLRTRSYDDKTGARRYVTEIIADSLTLLGKREEEEVHAGPTTVNPENLQVPRMGAPRQDFSPKDPEDDLPF